jgi:hypothetical protein
MDRVVPGARDIQTPAVGMPGHTEPRVIEHERVADDLVLQIDHADRRLRVAAVGDEHRAAVGRFDHRQR